ncbi:MAG: hypothetical protein AB8H79_04940 [Myxococcota bacterium]
MQKLLLAAALLGVANVANAQELSFYDGDADGAPDVLIPDASWPTWLERGTGSPTVTYDADNEQWVMFFEARLTQDYLDGTPQDWSACQPREDGPRVVWAVGRATSPDGINNWAIDNAPVVLPEPGTWRACQTAHPWVVNVEGTYHMYFKAEQGFSPCTDGEPEPAWGCGRMTGVGYATSTDGESFSVSDSAEPLITITDFGFPTTVVVQDEGAEIDDLTWTTLLTRQDGVYLAQSTDAGENWELDTGNPVLEPGTWTFAQDEWFQPSLTCNPEGSTFPYTAWIGGRSEATGDAIDSLNTVNGTEWVGDGSPAITFEDSTPWRHWDAIRLGDDVYFFYTIRGDDQKLRLSLAKYGEDSTFSLDGALDVGRACLYGERPVDPEPTDSTDNTDDTDDTDTSDRCYCSTGANPATWPLAAGVLLLALARRRRRS